MSDRERIVTGQKYRILSDFASKIWDRISFWTKASDVELDNGDNIQHYSESVNDSLDSINTTLASHGQTISSQGSTITSQGSTITSQGQTITSQGQAISGINQSITSLSGRINTNATNISTLSGKLNGFTLMKVSSLPSSPNASTIYFIPK